MQDTPTLISALSPDNARNAFDSAESVSESRYRILSELSSDFSFVLHVSPDNAITTEWISETVVQELGHTLETLREKGFAYFVHPDDIPLVQEHIAAVLVLHEAAAQCRVRTQSGAYVRLHIKSRAEWSASEQRVVRIYGAAQNIEAQERLRENQEQTDLALRAGRMGIWHWDIAAGAVGWSREVEALHGMEPGEFPGTMQAFSDTIYPEDRAYIEKRLAAALKDGQEYEIEFRCLRRDGAIRWLAGRGQVIYDAAGSPSMMRGVVWDIHARKTLDLQWQEEMRRREQAEEALQESLLLYRTLSDFMPQMIWTARPDGSIDYYNRRWFEYTGLTEEETFAPEGWKSVLHPDDLEHCVQEWYGAVRSGDAYQIEYRFRNRETDSYRWFLGRAIPLYDPEGSIIKWFGTCTDIDVQKRNEERQRFLVDLDDRIRGYASPEDVLHEVVQHVGAHLGVSRCLYSDVLPEKGTIVVHQDYTDGVTSLAGPRVLTPFAMRMVERMRNGETIFSEDIGTDTHYEEVREAYLSIDVHAFVNVPLVKDGRLVALLSVNDKAPRKWTSEEIALLETVAERTWTKLENALLLQAERERSRQLTRAIQEVHHRTKNNLQAVSALLELQIPDNGDLISANVLKDALGQIKTIALVHDLLTKDQPMGLVDVGKVLENLTRLVASGTQGQGEAIVFRAEVESVFVPTKAATSLALLANELLTNALKHSPVSRLSAGAEVVLRLYRQEGRITLEVQDFGPGFPPDFNPDVSANIGLELVTTLVRSDLHGSITFGRVSEAGGGLVRIVFEESLLSD